MMKNNPTRDNSGVGKHRDTAPYIPFDYKRDKPLSQDDVNELRLSPWFKKLLLKIARYFPNV